MDIDMKKLIIAAAIAGAFLAGPAAAQMYVGAGAGSARTDTNDTAWKVYGGYQFSPTWGLELGYTDLGRNRGADAEAWSLAATATLPINERWSLLAKLGASENHVRFHDVGKRADLLMGVGVGYAINRTWACASNMRISENWRISAMATTPGAAIWP